MGEIKEIDKAFFHITKFFKETGMKKSKRNNHGNYNYRSIDQVIQAFSGMLVEHEIIMKVETQKVEKVVINKSTHKGNSSMDVCVVEVLITLKSIKDGSTELIQHHGSGMLANNNDRAIQGGVSDAWKYAIVRSFCVPFDGVPDEATDYAHSEPEKVYFTLESFNKSKAKIEKKFADAAGNLCPVETANNFRDMVEKKGFVIPSNVSNEISNFCNMIASKYDENGE